MLDVLNEACDKVDSMPPVATELDTVKAQVEELKVRVPFLPEYLSKQTLHEPA